MISVLASLLPSCYKMVLIMRYVFLHLLAFVVLAISLGAGRAYSQQSTEPAPDKITEILPEIPTKLRRQSSMREAFRSVQLRVQVQRFETMQGPPPFILDTTGARPLFRYERGGEVLVLTPVYTTRGDTLYKNDQGQVVLRLHRVGSATLFPRPRSQGVIAWTTGSASELGPPRVSIRRMTRLLGQIATDLAETLDHDLSISVIGATEQNAWLYLDAAMNVRSSFRQMRRAKAPDIWRKITMIRIGPAEQPAASISDFTMNLSITPQMGFSGRPSSLQIQNILSGQAALLPDELSSFPALADEEELLDDANSPTAKEVTFVGAR
ncbi:hypothetical protein MNBD_ALPHA06-400 [hydrothermal vent metagenome]|uniref:Uncharacterized protein n=1 Tax=hydrothermal vent metagenome TaxID=652676 RepID=A0A3B0RZT1_9ZZZZ